MKRSDDALAMLAAAATGVQVGAAIVATRWVVDQTTPVSLALMRYAIGSLCLLPFAIAARRSTIARKDIVPIALLGIGQFGILIVLLNTGLQYIPSARAALIFATFPLMTLAIGAAFGQERMTIGKTLGVLLTLAGIGIALSESLASGDAQAWIGDIAVAASTLTGAVCSILYRPYLRRYPALQVSTIAMLASVVFLALIAAGDGSLSTPLHLTSRGRAAVLFIGFSSGIGYFLWLWALAHATPTRVTIFLSLSPLTAAALGAAMLDERVTARSLAGALCVVAGLASATWSDDVKPAPRVT